MHERYPQWLLEQQKPDGTRLYVDGTITAQLHRIRKVEKNYGDLVRHFLNNTYQSVIDSLEYSADDERSNKPNPSKIMFEGNISLIKNLASYKDAAKRYRWFLMENASADSPEAEMFPEPMETPLVEEAIQQKFSLERDMQAALRRNIASLESALRIIDDGIERGVESGFIDITCSDGKAIVVVELKAGKADSRAIGQILGYMGDLTAEEGDIPVRGILVAHDFDKRAKAAARVVPTLALRKYSIEFSFQEAD